MSEHGIIDFSDVHQTRIRGRVNHEVRVTGQTLDELGAAASEKFNKLYGQTPYVVTSMDVREARHGKTGEFLFYDATAWAETP